MHVGRGERGPVGIDTTPEEHLVERSDVRFGVPSRNEAIVAEPDVDA